MFKPLITFITILAISLSAFGQVNIYTVTTVADTGLGSLRAAIDSSNSNAGPNEIRFNIPGSGPHTIVLDTVLPVITTPVAIDGTTQPGYSLSNPQVLITGNVTNTPDIGLRLQAINSEIVGLMIFGFNDYGIYAFSTCNNALIANNIIHDCSDGIFINTRNAGDPIYVYGNIVGAHPNIAGTLPNQVGIRVGSSSVTVMVGSANPGEGNTAVGNTASGIFVHQSIGTIIKGNAIGTDANGSLVAGNGGNGIYIAGASLGLFSDPDPSLNITVGGNTAAEANIIKNNGADGIRCYSGTGFQGFGAGEVKYVTIMQNIISNHASGKSINLFPSPPAQYQRAANDSVRPPIIDSVVVNGFNITVYGSTNSFNSLNNNRIRLFSSDDNKATMLGFLGETFTDVNGKWQIAATSVNGISSVAATHTDSAGTNTPNLDNTSELCPPYPVGIVGGTCVVDLGSDTTLCLSEILVLDAGTGFTSYTWSNGASSSQFLTVNQAGTYSVTVDNGNGCTTTDSITITYQPPFTVNLGADTTICNGSTVTLDAGAGYANYSWTGGSSSTNILNGMAGNTYTVVVTDSAGCTASDTITIANLTVEVEIISGPIHTYCAGGTVDIVADTGFVSYIWNTGATGTNMITVNMSFSYGVTATDANGCTSTASTPVGTPAIPVDVFLGSGGITNETCSGTGDGAIDIEVNATTSVVYRWSNNFFGQDLNNVSAGTYTITVIDGFNCEDVETYTVNAGPSNITLTSAVSGASCGANDGAIDLTVTGASPFTYNWSNNATTQDLANIASGSYTVTVTNTNGCQLIDSFTVTQSTQFSINLGPDTTLCLGSAVVLDAGTGYTTYTWSNGASTTNLLTVNQTGTYAVTVADGNGCTATDNVLVTVPDSMMINGSVQDVACFGYNSGQISLSVSGGTNPYSYQWSTGDTSLNLNNTAAGNYTLTITDAIGCTKQAVFTVNGPPLLVVSIGNTFTICPGDTLSLQAVATGGFGPYDYQWSNGATNVSSIEVQTPGTYTVFATDANGCIALDSAVVDTSSAVCNPSIEGVVYQSNNSPMPNTKVLLILFNSSDSSVAAIDSTTTDGSGSYSFTTNETTVYTKALPHAGIYPNEMPTYHLSSLVFQTADAITTVPNQTVTANINCIAGSNPGGAGFIGGFISQGAGKQQGPGDPVAGLTIVVMNNNNQPVAIRTTDQQGYFSVNNLALDTYSVWADQYGIDNNLAPNIELTATEPVQDSLEFLLQPTYLDLLGDSTVGIGSAAIEATKVLVFPNPFDEVFSLSIINPQQVGVQLVIYDLTGKVYQSYQWSEGIPHIQQSISLPHTGMYLYQVQWSDGTVKMGKLLSQ